MLGVRRVDTKKAGGTHSSRRHHPTHRVVEALTSTSGA